MLSSVVQVKSDYKPFIYLKDFVNLNRLVNDNNYFYKLSIDDIHYLRNDGMIDNLYNYKFYEDDFISKDSKGNKTFHYPSLFIKLFGGKYVALDSSLYIDKSYIEDLFRVKSLKQLKATKKVIYLAGDILKMFEERTSRFI